eukprot:jgi/Tetstr1/428332/TSEL_018367.t1
MAVALYCSSPTPAARAQPTERLRVVAPLSRRLLRVDAHHHRGSSALPPRRPAKCHSSARGVLVRATSVDMLQEAPAPPEQADEALADKGAAQEVPGGDGTGEEGTASAVVCSPTVATMMSRLVTAVINSLDGDALGEACRAVEVHLPGLAGSLPATEDRCLGSGGQLAMPGGKQYESAAAALYRVAAGCSGAVIETGGIAALMHILAVPVARVAGTASHFYALEAVLQLTRSEPEVAGEFVAGGGLKLLSSLIDVDSCEELNVKLDAMRLLAMLLRGPAGVAHSEAAMRAGVAPILVNVLRHTADSYQMNEAASLLQHLAATPQCADALLRQHVIDGLVHVIRDRKHVEPAARCKAAGVLQEIARARSPGLQRELERSASRCLVQMLKRGTEMEMEVAECALLEIAGSPRGAYYVHRAGLVPSICALFQAGATQYHHRRGCRLMCALAKCHEALDSLMQPALIEALGTCLKVGSPKTQQLACSTLVVLLRQCSASMAARARRLVLPLVCLVRESACPLEMRRDAASCLERLTKERGMRELVLASGAIGAVVRLLGDASDLRTCAWGIMLARNLSHRHVGVCSAFVRAGIMQQMVEMLDTPLGPQVVAALCCLNSSGKFSHEIVAVGAVPLLVDLLAASEQPGHSSGQALPCTPHCEQCMHLNHNAWRTKCLTAKLLSELMAPWNDVSGGTAEVAAGAIPPLVAMLAEGRHVDASPTFVDDIVDFYGSGFALTDPPSRALLAVASRSEANKERLLEQLALQVWQGKRAPVAGLESL